MRTKEAVAEIPLRQLLKGMTAKEVREALDTLTQFDVVYEYWVDDWHLIIIYNPDEELNLTEA